ncbi:hypothetical protein D3C75_878080 [compost metagenome]
MRTRCWSRTTSNTGQATAAAEAEAGLCAAASGRTMLLQVYLQIGSANFEASVTLSSQRQGPCYSRFTFKLALPISKLFITYPAFGLDFSFSDRRSFFEWQTFNPTLEIERLCLAFAAALIAVPLSLYLLPYCQNHPVKLLPGGSGASGACIRRCRPVRDHGEGPYISKGHAE